MGDLDEEERKRQVQLHHCVAADVITAVKITWLHSSNFHCRIEDMQRQERVARHLAQKAKVQEALQSGIPVCIECSIEANVSQKEMRSLVKQLELSMVANRRAEAPVRLTFTGFRCRALPFPSPLPSSNLPRREA